ncbi:MAG: protease modulator HflC [Lachnospiraceae bacterium]|nr:protease modulator HflC [Lachnospiraceae bacterium]
MENKANKFGRLTTVVVVALIAIYLFNQSVVITQPGEYRVVKQFGKIVSVTTNNGASMGISFKVPFIQSESSISSKVFLSDLTPSDVMTSDKKSMISDCFVTWRITDPILFIQKLSGSVTNAESRISSNVYNVLKTVISSLTQEEIISGRDGEVAAMIKEGIGDTLTGYGIEITGVETKMLDLPDENKDAVYTRMISERNNIAASYTAQGNQQAQEIKNDTSEQVTVILAQAQKQADTLIAEGEAEYMKILSEAYNDPDKAEFYSFVRQLDAVEIALKNGKNKIVLDKSSPIAEIFY